jgi:CHAT domain-containing protein
MIHRSNHVLILLVAGLAAAAVLWLPVSTSLLSVQEPLLRGLSEVRLDGGRFFRSRASQFDSTRYRKTLANAEVFLLSATESPANTRLRALIDAGGGNLRQAAEALEQVSREYPRNAEVLNDLGVVFLGMGPENATNYFRAAALFERAAQVAPQSPVPHFNAAVALRRAQIHGLADRELREFQRLQSVPLWRAEPPATGQPPVSQLIDQLRRALESNDVKSAQALLDQYSIQYRKAALDYALNPPKGPENDPTIVFVLSHFANTSADQTAKAILAPMQSANREQVMVARRLVEHGRQAYLGGHYQESLQFYEEAESTIKAAGSEFDVLRIKLKRADTQLRLLRTDPHRKGLDLSAVTNLINQVAEESSHHGFESLLGQALVSRSAALSGVVNYDETLAILEEAVQRLSAFGSPEDLVRPLYYMATLYLIAGDYERSLDTAYKTLQLTPPNAYVQLAQLYWLAGLDLYRMGFTSYAKHLTEQALQQANASQSPPVVAAIAPYLALYHLRDGDYPSAEKLMQQLNTVRQRLDPADRVTADLSFNLLCGQIAVRKSDITGAKECLDRNLDTLNSQPRPAPDFFADTLLQLAEVYSAQGRFDMARQQLLKAMEVIEANDASLVTTALRMPFENQRRKIYERAIGFEYKHGSSDAAWSYTQRYRSKLFLEFLRQMSAGLPGILDRAVGRHDVQRLIPADMQVVEYVLLEDRLLVWVLSRDKFVSVDVPASRDHIETKISELLTQTLRKADIERESAELYRLLIKPVESHLDPHRTLAIVPDLSLHRLNFPALYSASSKKYLVQQYASFESPNLTTLLSGSGRPARAKAVAFGARTDNIGATRELRAVERIYGQMQTFNGQAAVKPAFLSVLGSASVFHYAGHSQDAADPLRSSVLLDGEREGANSVTAAEIARQKMPANSVVVLASCDSSVGNSRDGIGMRGLTSAFLIGGAGSVVGSLWLVESESTSRLVVEFHKHFAQNIPVAAALRNAQLAFIADGIHPYYWSGFVVTGNSSALR